jgi:hypothetical protein
MPEGTIIPVIAGLIVGSLFVATIALLKSPFTVVSPNIKLREESGDLEGQKEALDVLLSDPDVRSYIEGKNYEVWVYGRNYPQASLNEGVCEKDECTLIGIIERNPDDTTDCALATFVNVETRQVDDITYFNPCDMENSLS